MFLKFKEEIKELYNLYKCFLFYTCRSGTKSDQVEVRVEAFKLLVNLLIVTSNNENVGMLQILGLKITESDIRVISQFVSLIFKKFRHIQ